MKKNWYVVYTKARNEKKAALLLEKSVIDGRLHGSDVEIRVVLDGSVGAGQLPVKCPSAGSMVVESLLAGYWQSSNPL